MDGDDLTPQEKLEVRQLRMMTPEQQKAWKLEVCGPPKANGHRELLDGDEYLRRVYMLFKAEYGDDSLP